MNCTLEGKCVKAFGKAVQALSRISSELWLDPSARGLSLRAVNAAQSAYACFFFSPTFFEQYRLTPEPSPPMIKCKLLMKSLLPIFRCLTSIERNVERCQISVGPPGDRVVIQFHCRHGLTKTHNLCYQESEALQAVFASHLCPNVLKAPARLFGDMVMHFPASQEEITLSMTPLRVSLRNYHHGGNDNMKMMLTEMFLHPDEFDCFHSGGDSDITFCLKELRGLLSFAESHGLPVYVHFSDTGKPVCFSVEDLLLEATVVLATVTGSEPSQPTDPPAPTSPRCADAGPSCPGEADSNKGVAVPLEVIPSSQGSPIVDPAPPTQRLPQIHDPGGHDMMDEGCASIADIPASSTVCSLLFRAVSSELDCDCGAARLPVLACFSDMEDDVDRDS